MTLLACAPAAVPPTGPELPTPPLPDCQPNLDGTITASELPFLVGATAYIRVGVDVVVDVDGQAGRDGARVWDLSRPEPDQQPRATLRLTNMNEHWFQDEFPDAPLAGPLAPNNTLYGALSVAADGVMLYGAASADEDAAEGKTLLVYDAPVMLYPLPLSVGVVAETTNRTLGAVITGIPTAFEDVTTIEVTAHGSLVLPDLAFDDVLRVTIRLQRTPVAGVAVQQISHVFIAECVGEVARIVSPAVPLTDALDDSFPLARDVWRLSF
jgi:hypothetical protein